jgi:hypothetical protein
VPQALTTAHVPVTAHVWAPPHATCFTRRPLSACTLVGYDCDVLVPCPSRPKSPFPHVATHVCPLPRAAHDCVSALARATANASSRAGARADADADETQVEGGPRTCEC